ncbi:MAG TPA: integration host factor subunit beta [Burkholderiaceae bacterium]
MTRSELINAMSLRFPHLGKEDVEASVSILLEGMSQSLCQRRRIEIRVFGTFTLNHRPPRIGRNPQTGEQVAIPAKYTPHFKTSKELKQRVNMQAGQIK